MLTIYDRQLIPLMRRNPLEINQLGSNLKECDQMRIKILSFCFLISTAAVGQTDACSQIQASINALPPSGGTVDARILDRVQSCATNPFGSSIKPVTLLLAAVSLDVSVPIITDTAVCGTPVIQVLGAP